MSQGLVWRIPDTWAAPPFAARPWLYPALYLRSRALKTRITQAAFVPHLETARGLVLVVDEAFSPAERSLLEAAAAARVHRFVLPLNGLSPMDLRAAQALGAVVCPPKEDGPLSSPHPLAADGRRLVSAGPVRLAEDSALAREMGYAPLEAFGHSRWAGRYLLVAAYDRASLASLAAPIAAAARRRALRVVVATGDPLLLEPLPEGLETAVVVNDRDPRLLALLANAHILVGAFEAAPAAALAPTIWLRTALHLGVPAVAASHPSLDGWAEVCVLDDIERGLALYADPDERAQTAARAAAFLEPRLTTEHLIKPWLKALKQPVEPAQHRHRRPTLLVLIDLSQDIDLLLPILSALRDRARVNLRILVTDWLTDESPRTLAALREAGLAFELIPRGPVRKGQRPSLEGADAVLSASETTAGPHRSGRHLAERANAAGLCSFTLQHGFENIGLTYRDETYGEEIGFASQTVFTWGRPAALPEWVCDETRGKAVGVGSPKHTPGYAEAPELAELAPGFVRYVGVFENLHWTRYSDDFRWRFLDHLSQAAAAAPDTCFLVKPHQAGRWLNKNPGALAHTDNLRLIDPMAPEWRRFTAPALIAKLDRVITTPSTVALDAARAGRPVAVAGYGLVLDAYEPLTVLEDATSWVKFLSWPNEALLARNARFLDRNLIPGRADHRIAGAIEQAMIDALVGARVSETA